MATRARRHRISLSLSRARDSRRRRYRATGDPGSMGTAFERRYIRTYAGRPVALEPHATLCLSREPPLSFALGFSRVSTRFRRPRRVTHAPRATLSVALSPSLLSALPPSVPFSHSLLRYKVSRVPPFAFRISTVELEVRHFLEENVGAIFLTLPRERERERETDFAR